MAPKLASNLLIIAAVALIVAPALTHGAPEPPKMTPEQQAEMEAFMKAGTPGTPHQSLAATAGTYDMKIKSWHEQGAPALEDTGTATRTMTLDGRVMSEDVNSMMMGTPFKGHGTMGFD